MEEAGVPLLPQALSSLSSGLEHLQLWIQPGEFCFCPKWGGGVDHTLENLDVSYFDKVKSSMPETHQRADFSDPIDKNPSQECKFWVINRNSSPQSTYTSKAPLGHHWVLVRDTK